MGADRLAEFCSGRKIYQLVSDPEVEGEIQSQWLELMIILSQFNMKRQHLIIFQFDFDEIVDD